MNWKKVGFFLYPILIGFLLPLFFYLSVTPERRVEAGTIRRAELSSDRPLVVRLAIGRSTAISFSVRPEKVVAGNPQAVEINFLGRDLTLRPLGHKPGNLIIYTKNNRYVILLQVVSETSYDDAVIVNANPPRSRPFRLLDDTFLIENVTITDLANNRQTVIPVMAKRGGSILESDSFPVEFRCQGCVTKKRQTDVQLACGRPIQSLRCRSGNIRLSLTRPKDRS